MFFESLYAEKLRDKILHNAIVTRNNFIEDKIFILAMDASPHKQFEKCMNVSDLEKESHKLIDLLGLNYLGLARTEGTHLSIQAEEFIHRIYSKVGDDYKKYFRADSAYGKFPVYSALKSFNVKHTIVLRKNIARYVRKKNN